MRYKEKMERWSDHLTRLAQESILYEVVLSPKPGLVDALDSGAHQDMDVYTFLRSAASLHEGFRAFAMAGLQHEGTEKELFQKIRPVGMESEKRMMEATDNINTHKGVVFSLGIVLAASGFYLRDKLPGPEEIPLFDVPDSEAVFQIAAEMTRGLVAGDFRDLEDKAAHTHGETLYLRHGFTGIRGEAEKGYPMVRQNALPRLRELQGSMHSDEDRFLEVLLHLMSMTEDSNVISRGGMEALEYVRAEASAFLEDGGMSHPDARNRLNRMNEAFKARNISPGGSADLLSMTIYFARLEKAV